MAGKTLDLHLVTPERVTLETKADFVVLPALEGEMGVLPGHATFLVQLAPGEVRVTSGGEVTHLAVSGGFAEVKDNRVSLFAETAEMAGAIDAERAKQSLEKAKAESLRKDLDPLQLMQAEAAMRRAEARLRVAQLRRSPSRPSRSE